MITARRLSVWKPSSCGARKILASISTSTCSNVRLRLHRCPSSNAHHSYLRARLVFKTPHRVFCNGTTPQRHSNEQATNDNLNATKPINDPALTTWVDTSAPPSLRPYLRLARADRPIGTWLLLIPCWWGVAITTPAGLLPDLSLMAMFAVGAFVMRGAGCTINDLWDRDIDGKVARTKTRPLAAGDISVPQAIAFLGLQLSTGLGVLLTFNQFPIIVGLCSMPFVCAYPLFKRFFSLPQLVLGFTFNWGVLVGAASVANTLDPMTIAPLYAAGVSWTMVYDTIYAHQDKVDDKTLGLKSTALTWGENSKRYLSGFSLATMFGITVAGAQAGLGVPFMAISVFGGTSHLMWQIFTVNLDNERDCMSKFVSNKNFGLLILAGIIIDKLFCLPVA